MKKEYFVDENSIVRKIWGKSDTILFIFAGAAAEFALSKAVDWLYFTGRLPRDPLGRLMSTVKYARLIVFSDKYTANTAINTMTKIHGSVENKRGKSIPDWAYRDVLFMLIDYSIRSYELLYHPLKLTEKQEVFDVFYRVGSGMGIKDLPSSFNAWNIMRQSHLNSNYTYSRYTKNLFDQYRKHLGWFRYKALIEAQKLVVPNKVSDLLNFGKFSYLTPIVPLYKFSRFLRLDDLIKHLLLPTEYKEEIKSLDMVTN